VLPVLVRALPELVLPEPLEDVVPLPALERVDASLYVPLPLPVLMVPVPVLGPPLKPPLLPLVLPSLLVPL
jgi:hypothetical protein